MPYDAHYVSSADVLKPFGGTATPPIDPPPSGFPAHPVFGASVTAYPGTGRSQTQEWAQHKVDLGEPGIVRTFNTAGTPSENWDFMALSGNTSPRQLPGWETRWSWISPKPTVSKVISGELHNAIIASVNTIPVTGYKRMITMWHEPENNLGSTFTAAQYKEAAYRYGLAVKEADHPDVLYGPIFMSKWSIDQGQVAQIMNSTSHDLASVCDFVGWDPYNEASYDNSYNANRQGAVGAAYYYDPCWNFTQQYFPGVRFAIGEFGYRPRASDANARANWLHASAQYFIDKDALAVCYYDASVGSGSWLRVRQTVQGDFNTNVADPASIAAWASYYTDYAL